MEFVCSYRVLTKLKKNPADAQASPGLNRVDGRNSLSLRKIRLVFETEWIADGDPGMNH
jgi:hypothetical protein